MEKSAIDRLAICVQSWLDFQMLCGREMLLSEGYLAQPICEFLNNLGSSKIHVEWNHPNFKHGGRGRPKQLDYALLSRDSSRIVTALEAKWISSSTAGLPQRLLDDIMRLECLRSDEKQNVDRYFIVAGTKSNKE